MGSLVDLHIIELDPYLTNKDLLPTIPVEPYQGPQGMHSGCAPWNLGFLVPDHQLCRTLNNIRTYNYWKYT